MWNLDIDLYNENGKRIEEGTSWQSMREMMDELTMEMEYLLGFDGDGVWAFFWDEKNCSIVKWIEYLKESFPVSYIAYEEDGEGGWRETQRGACPIEWRRVFRASLKRHCARGARWAALNELLNA